MSVVLVHGNPETAAVWSPLVAAPNRCVLNEESSYLISAVAGPMIVLARAVTC